MADSQHRYILSEAASEAEVKRLQHIDEYMGPTTERRIARFGIGPGWVCLEVGAGVGGVARWLADRVGLEGRATAIDLNPLFERDLDRPQLEIRRHDILAEGLESEYYDLVHCRLLLANVGDVQLALKRMKEALRPGCWLIVEEPGDGRFPGVGESKAEVAEFNGLAELFLQTLQERTNAVDLNLYRRLPGLVEDAGFINIGGELTHLLEGVKGRAALLATVQAVRPLLAETPFAREGKIDRLIELGSDPKMLTMGGSTLGLWGQRPH